MTSLPISQCLKARNAIKIIYKRLHSWHIQHSLQDYHAWFCPLRVLKHILLMFNTMHCMPPNIVHKQKEALYLSVVIYQCIYTISTLPTVMTQVSRVGGWEWIILDCKPKGHKWSLRLRVIWHAMEMSATYNVLNC